MSWIKPDDVYYNHCPACGGYFKLIFNKKWPKGREQEIRPALLESSTDVHLDPWQTQTCRPCRAEKNARDKYSEVHDAIASTEG